MAARVCKYHCVLEKGQSMKKHWQQEHTAEYAKVRKWLGETDAKIVSAEILAAEGMRGLGGDEIPGKDGVKGGRITRPMAVESTAVRERK